MKKVESAERVEDTKLSWKAQVFWSHRTWQSTIVRKHRAHRLALEGRPRRWALTFHGGPTLPGSRSWSTTRKGCSSTPASTRRRPARLEPQALARHVMTSTVLQPDQVEGWRELYRTQARVVQDHETALREEGRSGGPGAGRRPTRWSARGAQRERGQRDPRGERDATGRSRDRRGQRDRRGGARPKAEYEVERPSHPRGRRWTQRPRTTPPMHRRGDRDRQGRGQGRRRPAPARTAELAVHGDQPQRRAQGATPGGGKQ